MMDRKTYKGNVIEARSHELKDGLGWGSEFYIEEHDGSGINVTQFHIPNVFPTPTEALRAAFAAGQEKIDSGFEHKLG